MRVAMFISSQYGLTCYKSIKGIEGIEIVGILTTPSHFVLRYGENKMKEMDNSIYQDVITENEINHIPIYITNRINDEKTIYVVKNWKPDLVVVSGWYHIIKEKILEIPPKGIVGLHSSLLPQYRGGAPLVWQLINGEEKTGITLFYMEQGTDTGDIIGQKEIVIDEKDDINTLYKKVGEKGIELLREYIPQIADDCAPRKKQINIEKYDIYPQRSKEDGHIDWSKGSTDIYNFVRAQTKPYPGAFSQYGEYRIYIWKCRIVKIKNNNYLAGTIVDIWKERGNIHLLISTGEHGYGIEIIDYSWQTGCTNINIEKYKKLT